jgi:hypothetical protein
MYRCIPTYTGNTLEIYCFNFIICFLLYCNIWEEHCCKTRERDRERERERERAGRERMIKRRKDVRNREGKGAEEKKKRERIKENSDKD